MIDDRDSRMRSRMEDLTNITFVIFSFCTTLVHWPDTRPVLVNTKILPLSHECNGFCLFVSKS